MFDWIEFPEPATEGPRAGQRGAIGYGYYQEEYVKRDGIWQIAFLRLTRQRLDPLFGKCIGRPPGVLETAADDWSS